MPVLETAGGPVTISVFGKHNVLNMRAAIDVCMELGVPEKKCFDAIATFTGAARRLEKIKEETGRPGGPAGLVVYRDFAHAPSKLKATLDAVREACPAHWLLACFELHTFSSLNEQFLAEYAHSLDAADEAIVYFSHHALEMKGLPALAPATVQKYFSRQDLRVIDGRAQLEDTVNKLVRRKTTAEDTPAKPVFLLVMSSGTFDEIDWNNVSSQ